MSLNVLVSDLVRNAFQHTNEGEVIIKQQGLEVQVINRDKQKDLTHETTGFGFVDHQENLRQVLLAVRRTSVVRWSRSESDVRLKGNS
ncbi:hypothetical protein [Vibrio diabolicus]|uniref:hypothetical protein n=1 Tax=Vibrio diabolicus TaxID=50719 RepID=UPI0024943D4F|nr:hypothetical protein [Vibrio diabolicus]